MRRRAARATLARIAVAQLALALLACGGGDHAAGPDVVELDPPPAGFLRFTTIDAAGAEACGLTADGALYCWGGQSGAVPARKTGVPPLSEIALAMTFSSSNSCGAAADGTAYCDPDDVFERVATSEPLHDVTAGTASCGLTTSHAALCWQYDDSYGMLGAGAELAGAQNAGRPVTVAGNHEWAMVSSSILHSCGLTTDGSAWCWGMRLSAQLGDGRTEGDALEPVAVAGGRHYATIRAGQSHTCAVGTDGAAYCWGVNEFGQAGALASNGACPSGVSSGTDTNVCVTQPMAAAAEFHFAVVSPGLYHTCGVATDGQAVCWGGNVFGQLGDHRTALSRPAAEPVAGGLRFRRVVSGSFFSCGIATNDETYCWGRNSPGGSLGAGLPEGAHRTVPTPVAAPANVDRALAGGR